MVTIQFQMTDINEERVTAEPAGNDISADPDSDEENEGSSSQHETLVPTTDEVVRICPR